MTRLAPLAALLLALAAGGPEEGRRPSTGSGPPEASDAGTPDGGAADPDQELIDHLDEIERLDLLRNLELFDQEGEGERPPAK